MNNVSRGRALYLSPVDMRTSNGMSQLQHQLLSALNALYEEVDILSLHAFPARARQYLQAEGIRGNVLDGLYPTLACLNSMLWYGGGVILCNKLRWGDRFRFPLRTPLPRSWFERYDIILCFYPWAHRLLRLDRGGRKVIVDTGDVMADRHERIGRRRWISLASEDERAILKSQSRCLAVSVDDADEFERLYGVRPPVQPFVPPEYQELINLIDTSLPKTVGYMGAPNYLNEELLRELANSEFLDTLNAAGVDLVVAGGICNTVDKSVLRTLERGGARVLGRVPSTVEYYRQIGATVNPIGPSTGVKIKSVETLVAGRALITTKWGADEMLATAFPNQVTYIKWPMDLRNLAECCIRATQQKPTSARTAAEAYVRDANRRLEELLSP